MQQVHQPAVADAFYPGQNLPALFYRREVYRHILNMSQRADAVANVSGMVVKELS